MKTLISGAVLLAAIAMPATAENRYDRKLEQAAMDIVASKMGDLRGGFAYNAEPAFVILPDMAPTGSIKRTFVTYAAPAPRWAGGLTPAVERKVARIVF